MKEHPARSPEGRVSPETRIHLDGLQAAAFALAGSCLPPPVSLAMDATGLDAVAWTQRRMLARLGIDAIPGGTMRNSRPLVGKLARSVAERGIHMLARLGGVKSATLVSRGAWIIGGMFAAVLAYRQTTVIGLRVVRGSALERRTGGMNDKR